MCYKWDIDARTKSCVWLKWPCQRLLQNVIAADKDGPVIKIAGFYETWKMRCKRSTKGNLLAIAPSGVIHPVGALFSAILARPTFSMISSAVFRQTNGLGSLL